jgi:hypothetical protein
MIRNYIEDAAQRKRSERVLPFFHNLLGHGGGAR